MKHYTKFLRATTLLLSLIVLSPQTTVTQEKDTTLELTKSNASFTATILALGSATDSSKLQLLPVILQTGIIQAAGSNPALTTTVAGTSNDGNINSALQNVVADVNSLLTELYTYINNQSGGLDNINIAISSLTDTEFGSIPAAIQTLFDVGNATSAYSTTQITNILNQLNSVVTALSNSPLNL